MKKLLILFIVLLSAYNIELKNTKINLDPQKYIFTIKKKTYFNKKSHIYTVITLKYFINLFAPKAKRVTFFAYDNYKISFNQKKINNPKIVFAFLKKRKKIPIENRRPIKRKIKIIFLNQYS